MDPKNRYKDFSHSRLMDMPMNLKKVFTRNRPKIFYSRKNQIRSMLDFPDS